MLGAEVERERPDQRPDRGRQHVRQCHRRLGGVAERFLVRSEGVRPKPLACKSGTEHRELLDGERPDSLCARGRLKERPEGHEVLEDPRLLRGGKLLFHRVELLGQPSPIATEDHREAPRVRPPSAWCVRWRPQQ